MIKKILIANRGEIACRIIKTCQSMGIKTVAVYSESDSNSLHVKMADESVSIGPSEAIHSYLCIEKLLYACKATKADAVHPGYGFLSENSNFCIELEKVGITFIGPPASSIEAMGDKITSKKIAVEAGVPTVPGYVGIVETAENALKIASQIGYPVMIKASAGGGGKGMRIAFGSSEVLEGFEISQSEAKKSFGDDRIFIEKYIEKPRHIEIQIVGDMFGNFVHLGERECSIQRRNQKIIEESPSPFIDNSVRKEMGLKAISLAKSVNYFSAGTVEFIVDSNQKFYFLEMNTRLQVEHPVTELVYNIDIVKEMINIASGHKLSFSQKSLKRRGWALESRIYAEDALRNFLPSSGRLTIYSPPDEVKSPDFHLRNDSGVYEGGQISIFYDPMISKLCVWATNRTKAILGMQQALDDFSIEGVANNLDFLSAVMGNNKFKNGDFSTAFIEEQFKDGFQYLEPSKGLKENFGMVAVCLEEMDNSRWQMDFNNLKESIIERVVLIGSKALNFRFKRNSANSFCFDLSKDKCVQIYWNPRKGVVDAILAGVNLKFKIDKKNGGYDFRYRGSHGSVKVLRKREAALFRHMIERPQDDVSKLVISPMPGLLVKLAVSVGDKVVSGQALCVVEAMKMENVIRAEKNSIVKALNASVGKSLSVGDVIIEFE